jgi:uncharacterized protein YaiL (DUF2058 family)
MGLSLRDQLIQAGLAKPQPEKPAGERRGGRGHGHKPHGGKPGKAEGSAAPKPGRPAPDAQRKAPTSEDMSLAHAFQLRAEAEKREREEAKRRAEEEARRKREQREKLAQLVAGKALNDPAAEHARNFTYGKKIRKVNVTPEQLRALNAGETGVVQVDGRFLILPAELVREALALASHHVALFVPEGIGASAESAEESDDPRFQVPDDLVW